MGILMATVVIDWIDIDINGFELFSDCQKERIAFTWICRMGPELEVKPKSGAAMEVSVAKDGTTHHDVVVDDKFMPCVSNYKDNILEMEETLVGQTTASNKRENAELNRTGSTSPDDVQIPEGECGDLTENSSSFGDTISGTEDGSTLDGDEADSQLGENEHASVYDGYFGAFQTRYIVV